ncbi:hypothetical protein BsWGS_25135 [Bradybaena similaris]
MAERVEDVENVQETAHCSAGCQAATDNFSDIFNFFKGMAIFLNYKVKETQERNEGCQTASVNLSDIFNFFKGMAIFLNHKVKEKQTRNEDCQQATTDGDLEDFATQDHTEALSELEAVCEDEFELSLHRKRCPKKDRHGEFIPIREFSIDNLDPPYKDPEIVKVVKLMAALTVRLWVRQISPSRPPPPYPPAIRVDKNGGSPCPITGSGFVQGVWVYREDSGKLCPCSECKDSASPRTTWGKVHIYTAGHVVFDGFEAERTTCYFDFDEDDTDIARIPSLTGSKDFTSNKSGGFDLIDLFSYTHDVDFAERLIHMTHECKRYRCRLTHKYYGSDTKAFDLNYYHKAIDNAFSVNPKLNPTMNYEWLDDMVDVVNKFTQQNYTRFNIPKEIIHQCLDHFMGNLNTDAQQDNPALPRDLQPKGNLVIVVSHPHGCGKYVSLGEYTSRPVKPLFDTQQRLTENLLTYYVYTAHTCPGSSGGPVFILSKENVGRHTYRIHSKFLTKRNLSRCSLWLS